MIRFIDGHSTTSVHYNFNKYNLKKLFIFRKVRNNQLGNCKSGFIIVKNYIGGI